MTRVQRGDCAYPDSAPGDLWPIPALELDGAILGELFEPVDGLHLVSEPCDRRQAAIDCAATRLAELVNAERRSRSLPELRMLDALSAAAEIRLREVQQLFSHARPVGDTLADLLERRV